MKTERVTVIVTATTAAVTERVTVTDIVIVIVMVTATIIAVTATTDVTVTAHLHLVQAAEAISATKAINNQLKSNKREYQQWKQISSTIYLLKSDR